MNHMLGHFSPEALKAFAQAHNLNTGNQDFSEGVFDFKVCQKPDGKHYGIPDDSKCVAPAKEVKSRPDTGFLNTQAGRGINYDTAKQQGQQKTLKRDREKAKAEEEKRFKSLGEKYLKELLNDIKVGGASPEWVWENARGILRARHDADYNDLDKFLQDPKVKAAVLGGGPKKSAAEKNYEQIVDRIQEVRKGLTRHIVERSGASWDSESDPRRLAAVKEAKALMKSKVDEITKTAGFTPDQRRRAWEEISQGIESNL